MAIFTTEVVNKIVVFSRELNDFLKKGIVSHAAPFILAEDIAFFEQDSDNLKWVFELGPIVHITKSVSLVAPGERRILF